MTRFPKLAFAAAAVAAALIVSRDSPGPDVTTATPAREAAPQRVDVAGGLPRTPPVSAGNVVNPPVIETEQVAASTTEPEPAVEVSEPRTAESLRSLMARIRSLPPGDEKGKLVEELLHRAADPAMLEEMIDGLPAEQDAILREQTIGLLQDRLDAGTAAGLIRSIRFGTDDTARQDLLLRVMADLRSPEAMPALRAVARDTTTYTYKQPLLFYSLRSLARSGETEDVEALFDRIDMEELSPETFQFAVTAATELSNPAAVPQLLARATRSNSDFSDQSQLIAVYALRNYRGDPAADQTLLRLSRGSNRVALAAREALSR